MILTGKNPKARSWKAPYLVQTLRHDRILAEEGSNMKQHRRSGPTIAARVCGDDEKVRGMGKSFWVAKMTGPSHEMLDFLERFPQEKTLSAKMVCYRRCIVHRRVTCWRKVRPRWQQRWIWELNSHPNPLTRGAMDTPQTPHPGWRQQQRERVRSWIFLALFSSPSG